MARFTADVSPRPRTFRVSRSLLALLPLVGAYVLVACGDATPRDDNGGMAPNGKYFDPGRGGYGDGYGSGYGANGGSNAPAPVSCPEDLKRCDTPFTFPVGNETAVEVRGDWAGTDSWSRGVAMTKSGSQWTASIPLKPGSKVQYKFCINPTSTGGCASWQADPKKPTEAKDGNNVLESVPSCTTFSCDQPPAPPAGVFDWRDANLYFVFVDRFFDGDSSNNCSIKGVSGPPGQYQGGDWKGVTKKINEGYFTDLGINALWITVPMANAHDAGKGVSGDNNYYSAYHGYWPKELDQAESCFGTKQDLLEMVTAAHGKGIKVLFDYAMVHVHISSSIYQKHQDWFFPNQNGSGGNCICGSSCDWNADGKRCWFTDYLPHWNFNNADAREYSVSNALQWIKETGIDGYRLDAIKHVEDSWLTTLRSRVTSEILAKQNPRQRFYMVGETFSYDRGMIKSFVDPDKRLDGQFDFPARLAIVKSVLTRQAPMSELAAFYDSNDNFYGSNAVMSPFVGNHDIGRAIHMAEDKPSWDEYSNGDKANAWTAPPGQPSYRRPYERLANALAVIYTNKGAPLLYYGDEVGLAGAGDPDNRRFMPWSNISADQLFVRERVKKLTAVRNAHPALRRGSRRTIVANNDLWFFAVTAASDTVYVAINRGDSDQTINGLPGSPMVEALEGGTVTGTTATIPARQARVFVAK